MPYIGMTEAGDAGWNLSWYDKILNRKWGYGISVLSAKQLSSDDQIWYGENVLVDGRNYNEKNN